MGLRDIALTLAIFGALPFIFSRPYLGILIWSWLSYMNPHRLTWGFAYTMPFAQIVAIVTIVSFIFSKEPKKFPINAVTIIWLVFLIWMLVTTFNAIYFDSAITQLIKVYKIQFITILSVILITTRERIYLLIWVIVISIGFYGIKGGIFTLAVGGGSRVYGPPGSFIEENNSLALALLMILPLIRYLFMQEKNKWIRFSLLGAMVLCSFSILGSFSRGAFLAAGCVAIFFWLKGSKKIISGVAIVGVAVIAVSFMPQHWHQRMDTIRTYDEDISAMGRILAWRYTVNVASARITGAGFESWSTYTFQLYAPLPADADEISKLAYQGRAAHSIYFSVLGDHGWFGLLLFLIIGMLSWRTGTWIIKNSKEDKELKWLTDLARMIQVSLIAYGSGGMFLSLAYYDLPWHLMAILIISKQYLENYLNEQGNNKSADSNGSVSLQSRKAA